jgi:hypothetical protein
MFRCLVVLMLAGCATKQPPFDVAGLEPNCARSCLADHSRCASQATMGTGYRLSVNDVLRACRATADACLSTCPAK